VQLEGVGRSIEPRGEDSASLQLNVDGESLELRIEQAPADATHLIDARLRVQGLAAGAINDRRQLITPYLLLHDLTSVQVVTPAPLDAFAREVVPVVALPQMNSGKASLHRVKVRGVALSGVLQGGFFLRDGERSLHVLTSQSGALQPGDEVEAVGFVEMGAFSARLGDAVWQVTGLGALPKPRQPNAKDLAGGGTDADLVALEARVVQTLDEGRSFIAQSGSFPVKVVSVNGKFPNLAVNSTVQFTGLCKVTATKEQGYRANATDFEVLLRSPDDLYIIAAPPWWTATKLTLALSLVAALGLLALAWAALLKKQVSSQLAVIESKAQRVAVIEERQRIAREFHDTLEQELAGLSLRLDAATPRVEDEKARSLLEQLRKLLLRLQTETRDFVWDLRDASRHEAPLPEAIRILIHHLQSTTSVPLQCQTDGSVPELPPLTQHHLLRLTREAVHNAIKHAKASSIQVRLQSDERQLQLSISDDGQGFQPEEATLPGHFGLQGMKERARKLGTDLQIQSQPGAGTKIEVILAKEARQL
jgi:signal transduction histidine kinase